MTEMSRNTNTMKGMKAAKNVKAQNQKGGVFHDGTGS